MPGHEKQTNEDRVRMQQYRCRSSFNDVHIHILIRVIQRSYQGEKRACKMVRLLIRVQTMSLVGKGFGVERPAARLNPVSPEPF